MFKTDLRVDIQSMGGNIKEKVIELLDKGVSLIPVTIQNEKSFIRLMDSIQPVNLKAEGMIEGWTNFYRSDDWSSTAYFYLDKPVNQLPELAKTEIRTYKLK
jgi:hypothetical protein